MEVRFLLGVDLGTSLVVHRARLCTLTTMGTGLIPGWGTKIHHESISDSEELDNNDC